MEPKEYNREEEGMSVEDQGFYGSSESFFTPQEEGEKICPACNRPAKNQRGGVCDRVDCKFMGTPLKANLAKETKPVTLNQIDEDRTIDLNQDFMEPLKHTEESILDHIISEADLERLSPPISMDEFLLLSPGRQDEIERRLRELS